MKETSQKTPNGKGMWKRIILHTCIVMACIMGINLVVYMISGSILLGLSNHGSEISITTGFGLESRHYYPMQPVWEADTVSSDLRFESVSFIVSLIAIFLIMTLIHLGKRKHNL